MEEMNLNLDSYNGTCQLQDFNVEITQIIISKL
jgi:hypothetical protein